MWRSLVRSSLSVRCLCEAQVYKVSAIQTLFFVESQSPLHFSTQLFPRSSNGKYLRFLSNQSANPSNVGSEDSETNCSSSISLEEEHSSSSSETDDLPTDHDLRDILIGDVICENGESQMEDSVPKEEDAVFGIDVEKFENVLSMLQSSVDGSLESTLDNMELIPNEEFMVKLLQTPLISGENLIRFFKWASNEPQFRLTSYVVHALVHAISGDPKKIVSYYLWDLLKEIGEKESGMLNVEILNDLIGSFAKLGKGKAALEVFDKFEGFGCVPDADTYYLTISALCHRDMFDRASYVCEKMLEVESLPDNEKIGQMIFWFCKGSKAKDAHLIYLLAKEKKKYPPHTSVNYLIGALCCKDETVKLALEMLDDFSGEALKYAIKPFSAVIYGLCRMKDMDGAKNLLSKMIAEGPPPGNAVFNYVINGYSKAGDLEKAKEIMKLMKSRGLKPDVYTYTVIMSGYTNGGQMEEACKVLAEAKKKHSKLSPVTYHTLIRGYCKLEEYDKALKLLNDMKDFGVQPNTDEYNKLIQSLCLKALDWESAEKLLQEMKENGLHLNGITKGLIKAVEELEKEGLQTGELTVAS